MIRDWVELDVAARGLVHTLDALDVNHLDYQAVRDLGADLSMVVGHINDVRLALADRRRAIETRMSGQLSAF